MAMSDKQREAWDELISSLWDVGFSYGFDGVSDAEMVLRLGAEVGGALPGWILPTLYAGRSVGAMESARMMDKEGAPDTGPDPVQDDVPVPL